MALAEPVDHLSGEDLRKESASNLAAIVHLDVMRRRLTGRQRQIEARLLNDPEVKLKPGEGIPAEGGVMRVHEEVSGRAFVVKEEVDKRAGELPDDLEPQRDHRVVIESMNRLKEEKPALAAELLLLTASPFEADDEPIIEMKEKVKYPTVAKLRKQFGEDTAMVGKPAKVRMVVLEMPGVGDTPILVGAEGMILDKKGA